jgi:hypothetical protein
MSPIISIQVGRSTEDNENSLAIEMPSLPRMSIGIPKISLEENIIFAKPPFLKMREVRYASTLLLPTPNWPPSQIPT